MTILIWLILSHNTIGRRSIGERLKPFTLRVPYIAFVGYTFPNVIWFNLCPILLTSSLIAECNLILARLFCSQFNKARVNWQNTGLRPQTSGLIYWHMTIDTEFTVDTIDKICLKSLRVFTSVWYKAISIWRTSGNKPARFSTCSCSTSDICTRTRWLNKE